MLLEHLEIFYYAVFYKSFTKAAEKLKVSKSFISKKIDALESDLKIKLIIRTTRQLQLTEAGEILFSQAEKIMHEAEKGLQVLNELQEQPSGVLKISLPPVFATYVLAPMLADFAKKYPQIKLNIQLDTRLVDIIAENYDVALRSAILPDSSLIAQKMTESRSVVCATTEYFTNHSLPKKPEDLKNHFFAYYSNKKEIQSLRFMRDDEEEIIEFNTAIMSNSMEMLKQLALQHACIVVLPEFMIKQELKENKIQACLPDYKLACNILYAVYPERELMPLKLKLFLAEMKQYLSRLA